MKSLLTLTTIAFAVIATTQVAAAQSVRERARLCPAGWQSAVSDDCAQSSFTLKTPHGVRVRAQIRHGYLSENPAVAFRGNVIFYEGLGDSMVNHAPLFGKLTKAGFRVIAFDYMGQGGSTGSMNDTKISEIRTLAKQIWLLHARDLTSHPAKNIIGWSTGGLAAYSEARKSGTAANVVLIAPGLVPNVIIGEQQPARLKFNQITLPTLTTDVYRDAGENPHLDPIKPDSPLEIMGFSYDLTVTSMRERHLPMSKNVSGLVLLSGPNDTYVDAGKTHQALKTVAPHFEVRQYAGALHEIDNEAEPIRTKAHAAILDFLARHNPATP